MDEAVRILRPQWLRVRPSGSTQAGSPEESAIVYLNGSRFGGLNSLQQIPTQGVQEARYYSPADATTRFGTGHGGGAIVIQTGTP